MKQVFFACLLAGMFLSGCGSTDTEMSENEIQEQVTEQTAEQADSLEAPEEETNEYSDLTIPFESAYTGASIDIQENSLYFEIRVVMPELNAETRPENWENMCAELLDVIAESQAISDSNYEAKSVTAQLQDSSGAILCNAFDGKIQYDAFKTVPIAEAENSPSITLAEYEQIAIGMTYTECVDIIGGDGTLEMEVGSAGSAIGSLRNYTWKGTTETAVATLTFDDFVLYSKFQIGLE